MNEKESVNVFQKQLLKLLEYLDTSAGTFARECGFSTNALIQGYIDGLYQPTFRSITKIRDRYPVRLEWLVYGKDEMWENDYFETRFIQFCKSHDNTIKGKIECLMLVFEANTQQLSKRFNVSKHTINNIVGGKVKSISEANLNQFYTAFPYITKEWYN